MLCEEAFLNHQSSILSLLFKLFKLSLKQKRDLPDAINRCDWEINEYKREIEEMRFQYEQTHSIECLNRARELHESMIDKYAKREIYLRDADPLTSFIDMLWSHMDTIIHCPFIEEVASLRLDSLTDLPEYGFRHHLQPDVCLFCPCRRISQREVERFSLFAPPRVGIIDPLDL